MKSILATTCLIVLAPIASFAGDWETQLGAGFIATDRSSTNGPIVENPFFGGYLEGYAGKDFGDLRFSVDGRIENVDDKGVAEIYYSGPVKTGVVGMHFGKRINGTLIGVYAGAGIFDGIFRDDGWTVGIEAERSLGNGAIFAQLGYVEAIGSVDDMEFRGSNLRIGYEGQLANRWRGLAALEYAYSPECFEDCGGDWGKYWAAELGTSYEIKDGLELTGNVRISSIIANTEDDGSDTSLYLGVRKSFGGSRPSSNLRTPMGGFHAAGWMWPLD